MIIGVISDTHGLVRPAALTALVGSDLIIHAGDIGSAHVLDALATIAPVTAVRGNCDVTAPLTDLVEQAMVRADGLQIRIIHDVKQLKPDPAAGLIDIVISGHSHKPLIARRDDTLYVNPGSAGPRRFRLPVSIARLTIENGHAEATIITLPF